MKKLLLTWMALPAIGLAGACGGKVVLDAGSTGTGAGGVGGAGSVGSVGGGSCPPQPPDPASLSECTSTASTGTAMAMCQSAFCDSSNEGTWFAACQDDTCQCQFQAAGLGPVMTLCSCTPGGGADACASGTNCCGFSTQ